MKSTTNTYHETFGQVFSNGSPFRPNQYGCQWRYNNCCNCRPMPTCNQVCYPSCRPSCAYGNCNSMGCNSPTHNWGCRTPYGGTSYDGCTKVYCNDHGCRVTDSYTYGGSCRCNNGWECNQPIAPCHCSGSPMPYGGGVTNLNAIQIDVAK